MRSTMTSQQLKVRPQIIGVFKYLLATAAYFTALFIFFRAIFICINFEQTALASCGNIASAFVHGLVFDFSIIGYLLLFYSIIFAIALPFNKLNIATIITGVLSSILIIIMSAFLPADAFLYTFWGYHFDASGLAFIKTPKLALASLEVWQTVLFVIAAIALSALFIKLLFVITNRFFERLTRQKTIVNIAQSVLLLIFGAAMIIPIRGGTGIAPLNSGRAFFCDNIYANHTALNPIWNFAYSLKRLNAANVSYHFMDDEVAKATFDSLMHESNDYPRVLNNKRPNIIVVMLESFSAHGIEFLGGINATPTIKSLLPSSITFNHVMAASNRSGKGMVAINCGHPVMPTISIIQYPKKTQTLSFIARELRKNGYNDQLFLYGGDLNFNNFNSLVTLAGYNRVITQFDFDSSLNEDKWGVHDQYTFDRMLETIEDEKEPFFNFFFTLSSHEPFRVPMEKHLDDPYLNSMYYTDQCLGQFIEKAKTKDWWKNTLLILIADHGHAGPQNVGNEDKRRYSIPMIWTGGALAITDTIVEKPATQIDLAKTLLKQLDINSETFTFSKNILDKGNKGFSFYDFNDGFGFINDHHFQVYDNQMNNFVKFEGEATPADSIAGKAILQIISNDNKTR